MTSTLDDALWNAAKNGDVELVAALASEGELIDTSNQIDTQAEWFYIDSNGAEKGPCSAKSMFWAHGRGILPADVRVRRADSTILSSLDDMRLVSCTPLHVAASNGHADVIELLVRLGSKAIDTLDNFGRTPIFAAAFYGRDSVIETLIRLGSKAIDTPHNNGWTPLFTAARYGLVSVIELLVRLGSKAIDTPTSNGCTPMQAAAWNGHLNAIETLFRFGQSIEPGLVGIAAARTIADCSHAEALCKRAEEIKVLKCLGGSTRFTMDGLAGEVVELLVSDVSEDEVAEVRYRVYFSRSLVHRLFFELSHRACSTAMTSMESGRKTPAARGKCVVC